MLDFATKEGFVVVCSWCKSKIKDSFLDLWYYIEHHKIDHSYDKISHGICPDCKNKISAKIEEYKNGKGRC